MYLSNENFTYPKEQIMLRPNFADNTMHKLFKRVWKQI